MAGLLDSIFGSKVNIPTAITVDPTAAATTAQGINTTATNNYNQYGPQLTSLIQGLFNNAYPQVNQALNTNSNLGQQLATTGTTSAQTNAMNYYRTLGLQTAAATGAPVSSAFSQNLGGSLGAQQILQNQQAGSGILSGVTSQESQLGMQMLQPSFGVLQSNLTSPGQVMSTETSNAQMMNEQNVLKAQYASQPNPAAAWMMNEITGILNSIVGGYTGSHFSNPVGGSGGSGAVNGGAAPASGGGGMSAMGGGISMGMFGM